jgi:hypothetical protein
MPTILVISAHNLALKNNHKIIRVTVLLRHAMRCIMGSIKSAWRSLLVVDIVVCGQRSTEIRRQNNAAITAINAGID